MIFYFTATGNSLYVAKTLEAQPISMAQAIHDEDKVYRAERIGIVARYSAMRCRSWSRIS